MSTGWTPEPEGPISPPPPYVAPEGTPRTPYAAPAPYSASGAPFGGPQGYARPAPTPYGAPGSFGPVAYAGPAPRRGMPAIAIVGIVVGSMLLVMILAAIAIPVFLNQRQQALAHGFDASTCAGLATDAVRFSGDVEAPGSPLLTSVEDLSLQRDDREDLERPVAGEYAFVMSCAGTGTWEDGFVAPVVVELLMDADGFGRVNYWLE